VSAGQWVVLLPGGTAGYAYGPFGDEGLAERFCDFVTAEIAPAFVVPAGKLGADVDWRNPTAELLAWRLQAREEGRFFEPAPKKIFDRHGVPYDPDGCRLCGLPQRARTPNESGHGRRWIEGAGYHLWIQPTDAQRKARMAARRALRTASTNHEGPADAPAEPRSYNP
jgi:hypothetical protein